MEDLPLKIRDQLIGGLKAGIPVCYRLAGIRQSSVKAKRSSSTACFEQCHYTRAMSVCVQQCKFIEALLLQALSQKINSSFSTLKHFSCAHFSVIKQYLV